MEEEGEEAEETAEEERGGKREKRGEEAKEETDKQRKRKRGETKEEACALRLRSRKWQPETKRLYKHGGVGAY